MHCIVLMTGKNVIKICPQSQYHFINIKYECQLIDIHCVVLRAI